VKIAHLSTGTSGGAALVAQSISRIQNNFGHESRIFSKKENLSSVEKAKLKMTTLISLANAKPEYAQLTHFTNLSADLSALKSFNPDVIIIHNWFNLMRERDIVSISSETPIVFVSHDARLASGGCHVTLGCENNKIGCHKCPAARINLFSSKGKQSLDSMVNQLGKYALVTPSNWLMREFSETEISSRATVVKVIANPSEALGSSEKSRQKDSTGRFKILFAAASLNSSYKGLDIFMEGLTLLSENPNLSQPVEVLIIGDGRTQINTQLNSTIKLTYLGKLEQSEVYERISESDLLVVSSISENYPGIIGEAQLLGCAVAASNVGGIPEMIEDGVSGFLFQPNPFDCMEAILRTINSPVLPRIKSVAKERAKIRHDEARINTEYEMVINELLKS